MNNKIIKIIKYLLNSNKVTAEKVSDYYIPYKFGSLQKDWYYHCDHGIVVTGFTLDLNGFEFQIKSKDMSRKEFAEILDDWDKLYKTRESETLDYYYNIASNSVDDDIEE